mgnify:CR=1 FL=1
MEKTPLVINAVFPDSTPREISLMTQYEIVPSEIITYVNNPPMNVQSPSSLAVRCLVTTSVKIIPVMTLLMPTAKEIKPE